MSSESIEVVLATYNGERFLREQLDSVLDQTLKITRVLVADDGSKDNSLNLVKEYSEKFPGRIRIVATDSCGKGASGNFNRLLLASEATYVFFCDQDDVWDQDKVAVSLERMRLLENENGKEVPILVHTDLRVVDQNLELIASSFFEFQNLKGKAASLNELLVQNMVTGCTVVANRSLVNKALPVPDTAVMHDWWFALVAAAFGKIGYVNRATISYRQHSLNTVGAKGWSLSFISKRLKQLASCDAAGALLAPSLNQAKTFFARYYSTLSFGHQCLLESLASLDGKHGVSRVYSAAKLGFKKQGAIRTVGYYWALLTAKF